MTADVRTRSPRDEAQAAIRDALDRHKPLDMARRSLELIAETSIRPVEDGGRLRFQVVDAAGEPRMVVRDGRTAEMTVDDLVAEMREKHPTLFGVAPSAAEAAATPPRPAPDRPAPAAATPAERPGAQVVTPRQRSTVVIDPPSQRRGPAVIFRDWSAKAASALQRRRESRSAAPAAPAALKPATTGTARPAPAPMNAAPGGRRFPATSLALLALLALLGGLAYAFLGGSGERAATAAGAPGNATGSLPAAPPAGSIAGAPEVIDTVTLRIDGRIVRLFGVEWARGGQAQDLSRYLRGRSVVCAPAPAKDAYRCEVNGQDLSRVVLYNGGARATADAPPDLRAAEERAKAERVGVWGRS